MDIGIIARRYARALLLFACENGHETLVYEQAQQLLFQYNELPEFRHTIENPMVSRTEKIKLLHNATAGADTCEELTKFFYLLLEKGAKSCWLSSCILSYSYIGKRKKYVRENLSRYAATGGNPQRTENAHPETLSGTHGGIQNQSRPRYHRRWHSGNRLLANRC